MKLLLEDGTEFIGTAFGAKRAMVGEVVFNTGMTGYVEALTDPSYRGQTLVLTYPLIGSYGVPPPRSPGSMEGPYESDRIQVQGLVVQDYQGFYSHVTAERSLGEWLASENIPAISGIDTRVLTQRLREAGTMKGWLFPKEMSNDQGRNFAHEVNMKRVFEMVAPNETVRRKAGDSTVLVVDLGAKDNLIRSLLKRNVTVVRAGWQSDLIELAEDADGVMLSNGPGNPKDLVPVIAQLRALMASYEKPIFGVCLGHQILALAAGGDTYKLKYGHRSVNQPVQDLLSRRCYITSQNHGYAVHEDSLPDHAWEPWFVNLNDGTNEGIRSHTKPFFSVQFHPEAAPGPHDAGILIDDFIHLLRSIKRG